jgi:hypothetical protein
MVRPERPSGLALPAILDTAILADSFQAHLKAPQPRQMFECLARLAVRHRPATEDPVVQDQRAVAVVLIARHLYSGHLGVALVLLGQHAAHPAVALVIVNAVDFQVLVAPMVGHGEQVKLAHQRMT